MYRDFTYIDDVINSLVIDCKRSLRKNKKYKNDPKSNIAPFRIVNIGNQKNLFGIFIYE